MEPPIPTNRQELPTLSTSLLGEIRRMDPAGWSRLVTIFAPIVYRWCRHSGVRESDAPDIVQEVFVTVSRSIGNFERRQEQGSFRAWLATITRSRVRDFFRKNGKHQLPTGGTDALNQLHEISDNLDSTINSDDIETPMARCALKIIQSEFAEVTWTAFWLTTIDGLKPSIAAERLGISLASVYQARTRVLRKLRLELRELPK
jgi:RNA polymerase sigma-70 factor (ECF subfamily)